MSPQKTHNRWWFSKSSVSRRLTIFSLKLPYRRFFCEIVVFLAAADISVFSWHADRRFRHCTLIFFSCCPDKKPTMSEDARQKNTKKIGGLIFVATYLAMNLVILYLGWDAIRNSSMFMKLHVSLFYMLVGLPMIFLEMIFSFFRHSVPAPISFFGPPAA